MRFAAAGRLVSANARRALHSSSLFNSTCVTTSARKVRLLCTSSSCACLSQPAGVSSDTSSTHSVLLHQLWNSNFALYLRLYHYTVCLTARAACSALMQLEGRIVYLKLFEAVLHGNSSSQDCKYLAPMIGKSSSDFSAVACMCLLLSNHCPPTFGLVIQVLPVNFHAVAELPWALAVLWLFG